MPVGLPALTRALKLQAKASKVGFDWNDPRTVLRKIREEADEIEAELDRAESDTAATAAEVGDLLFAAVNLARHLRADPEAILRQTNRKFERRFASIERALAARGKTPGGLNARRDGCAVGRGEERGAVNSPACAGAVRQRYAPFYADCGMCGCIRFNHFFGLYP